VEIGKFKDGKGFVDNGATGDFVHNNVIARDPKVFVSKKAINRDICKIDGTVLVPASEAYAYMIPVKIPGFPLRMIEAAACEIKDYDLVLGMPWLHDENPDID
jgi:hypothetical protein